MGCCGSKSKSKGDPEFAAKFSRIPIFWVLGGPGSGKGTQCARLVEKYGFVHLSSGDLLRAEVDSGSDIGKEIANIMVQGQLVPREIILDLLKKAMLKEIDSAQGYLIDGYPREVEQAEEFESKIYPCSLILYYECSDDTLKQRLLRRAETSGRADDNEETIMKRLNTFHTHSEPVISKYKSKVANIPADRDVDNIFEATCLEVDGVISAVQ